jgi:dephospho-CoA kinase
MLTYGLTGGIGSGKSTVARLFEQAGVVTHDADAIGRDLLGSDSPEARAVARRYSDSLAADGSIDRSRVAARVFSDAAELHWLEALMHPAIQREFQSRISRGPGSRPAFVLLEGAVLLESHIRFALDGLLVVTAPVEIRRARIAKRDGSTQDQIDARMRAQLPEHAKITKATHLIDNSATLDHARRQVRCALDQIGQEQGRQNIAGGCP